MPFDELLQIAAARQARAATPGPHAVPAPEASGLTSQAARRSATALRRARTGGCRDGADVHLGHRASSSAKRVDDEKRIAHATQHIGCVSPQRPPRGERAHGARMILEAREVRDRVAFDVPGGARRFVWGKFPRKRDTAHRRMLVEIAEGVDRRHRKAGLRRRFGGRPRRDARDDHAFHWNVAQPFRAAGRLARLKVSCINRGDRRDRREKP